jgi:hypothetical protein
MYTTTAFFFATTSLMSRLSISLWRIGAHQSIGASISRKTSAPKDKHSACQLAEEVEWRQAVDRRTGVNLVPSLCVAPVPMRGPAVENEELVKDVEVARTRAICDRQDAGCESVAELGRPNAKGLTGPRRLFLDGR